MLRKLKTTVRQMQGESVAGVPRFLFRLERMVGSAGSETDKPAPVHPGEVLSEEFLKPLELSSNGLAARMGVPGNRVSMIVAGKRSVTGETALLLEKELGASAEFWMTLQKDWELAVARDGVGESC